MSRVNRLPRLKVLDLRHNFIDLNVDNFEAPSSLQTLVLASNRINEQQWPNFCHSLQKLQNLETVDFSKMIGDFENYTEEMIIDILKQNVNSRCLPKLKNLKT